MGKPTTYTCPDCGGSGTAAYTNLIGLGRETTCPTCNGSGLLAGVDGGDQR